jgi:type III secretion protein C
MALPIGAATWSSKRFVYRAEDKPLTDVLQDFAASQGVPIAIDPQVKGRVTANFDARPEEFLQSVSKAYGLLWYHDRSSLFVYPSSAMQSRLFRMKTGNGHRVASLMRTLEVGDSRFVLRYNKAEQTLLAAGPPRHIEIVASVVESLEQGLREDGATVVRVFPLHHAVAADRRFGDNVSPGMVTLLSQLLSADKGNRRDNADLLKEQALGLESIDPVAPTALERTYGTKTPGAAAKSARNKQGMFVQSSLDRDQNQDDRALVFQADEGTNSVVVHGPVERMAQIEKLIRQLDRPQTLVEIEAAIIDVSTDALDSLGINWSLATSGGSSISVAPTTTTTGPQIATVAPLIAGATNITTLVANAGRQLMASVRALEGQGQARVVARPKVLGAENRVAMMMDKRIASVRVAGNLDAKLFSIEAGTTLQVLPQIVPGDGARQVKLSLRIQDGNFEGAVVDQVPLIKRTEINTEAVIREGESLLLGGISVESETKGRSGVPGLSSVPLLGGLFRVDDATSTRRERLFLLTPKVIGSVHSAVPTSAAPALLAPLVSMAPVPAASVLAALPPTNASADAAMPAAASGAANVAAAREALGLNSSGTNPPAPTQRVVTPAHALGLASDNKAKNKESKTVVKGVRL